MDAILKLADRMASMAVLPVWLIIFVYFFQGIKCAKCSVSMHKTCAKKYFKKVKNCPACKKAWTVALD